MRLVFGLLAGGLLALTAAVTATGSGPPKPYVANFHISGYGVYRRTTYETWKVPSCEPDHPGSGDDGTRRDDTTIKWSTVSPGTALVERIGPNTTMLVGRNVYGSPGILATGTVTHKVTANVENVTCKADGTEKRVPEKTPDRCGTWTYKKGYNVIPTWPTIPGVAGQNIAVGVQSNIVSEVHFRKDWNDCWGAGVNAYTAESVIHGKLPFAHLPAKIRGKTTVIAQGHETVTDDTTHSAGGYSVHNYDAYNGTNYITLVRIPLK